MSWLSDLLRRKRGTPPTPSTPPPGDIRIHCTLVGTVTSLPVLRVDDGTVVTATCPDSPARATFTLPGTTPPWGWEITFGTTTVRMPHPLPRSGDYEGPTLEYRAVVTKRRGVVRLMGRSFVDDDGLFLPVGASLFYALGHWYRGGDQRELVKENLQWLRARGVDYVRILGHVAWSDGQEIDPRWPGYDLALAELLDYAYLEAGIRTKLTVTGGGEWRDMAQAANIARAVIVGREHQMFLVEGGNELNLTSEQAVLLAQTFARSGVLTATGRGNAGLEAIRADTRAAGAQVSCLHTERGVWRGEAGLVRQVWDLKELDGGVENAEPPGPAASGAQLTDPLKLSLFRAGSAFCRSGAFCLHSGSGVYGRTYDSPHGRRYAKLADHPGLGEAFNATRCVTDALPTTAADWSPFNGGYGGPLSLEVSAGTVNKVYGARSGARFGQVIIGAEGPIRLRALHAMHVRAVSLIDGADLGSADLAPGEEASPVNTWGHLLLGERR